jgi:hypothetical protein
MEPNGKQNWGTGRNGKSKVPLNWFNFYLFYYFGGTGV